MQYANYQGLGKRVKVAYDRPWTGYGPFDPIWKEGLCSSAPLDDGQMYVDFDDGSSDRVDTERVVFLE